MTAPHGRIDGEQSQTALIRVEEFTDVDVSLQDALTALPNVGKVDVTRTMRIMHRFSIML